VSGTPRVIHVDAVPVYGGKNAYSGPLAYTLASLTSCSQATATIVARELGIAIEHLRFDLESEVEMAALIDLPVAGHPDFQAVSLQVAVTTPASEAEVERLRAETERRCPVFQLFTRAGVPIHSRWTHAASQASA
jgi:uncharacterized OsmC-like protein